MGFGYPFFQGHPFCHLCVFSHPGQSFRADSLFSDNYYGEDFPELRAFPEEKIFVFKPNLSAKRSMFSNKQKYGNVKVSESGKELELHFRIKLSLTVLIIPALLLFLLYIVGMDAADGKSFLTTIALPVVIVIFLIRSTRDHSHEFINDLCGILVPEK